MAVDMERIISKVEKLLALGKWANIDHNAYSAGQDAGRSMAIRPGVEQGGASRRIEEG